MKVALEVLCFNYIMVRNGVSNGATIPSKNGLNNCRSDIQVEYSYQQECKVVRNNVSVK